MQGCALFSCNGHFYCRHVFVLKILFYFWVRCRLTQSERVGVRRQRVVLQKLREADKWVIWELKNIFLCRKNFG